LIWCFDEYWGNSSFGGYNSSDRIYNNQVLAPLSTIKAIRRYSSYIQPNESFWSIHSLSIKDLIL